MVDAVSGNEISGLTLEDEVTLVDYISACGGVAVTLTASPELFDRNTETGVDCTTAERIVYQSFLGDPVTAPSTTLTAARSALFWREDLDAAPGTQWQTHDPGAGARVGLASGQPLFMTANQSYLPPGAGSSFYRQLCSFPGSDYTAGISFVATANTDTLLAGYVRYVDNNNSIRLEYLPGTTTWNLVQRIAGVDTVLATAANSLAADGLAGNQFNITLAAGNITITDSHNLFPLTYVTTHLTAGSIAMLITATAANVSGFGSNAGGFLFGQH